MHHFFQITLQYIILAIFAVMLPFKIVEVIKAVLHARKTGVAIYIVPDGKSLLWGAVMMLSIALGAVLYRHWGWDLMISVAYYATVPLVLAVMFVSMNTEMLGAYYLARIAKGQFTWTERAVYRIWGVDTQLIVAAANVGIHGHTV